MSVLPSRLDEQIDIGRERLAAWVGSLGDLLRVAWAFQNDDVVAAGVDDVFNGLVFVSGADEEKAGISTDLLVAASVDGQRLGALDSVALADDDQRLMVDS